MSSQALARALEISVRTLYRDVDQLTAAGVPIYAERGRLGGFQLLEGWRTTLTGFTPSEAQAVFLSGLAGPASDLGLGQHVESARLKLLATLPAPWRENAQRISSRFHLDPVDWYRESDPVPHLATVADAVWNERALSIRYESWSGTTQRVVSPLGLVLKAGTWYLVASSGDEPRTYRIANIQAATRLEACVKRPRKFELPSYWAQSIRRFEAELYTGRATLLATPGGLKDLRSWNNAVAKAIGRVPPSRRKDGRTEVTIPIESIDSAVGQLLRFSPQVEVLKPAALRRAMVRRLNEIAQLYGIRVGEVAGSQRTVAAKGKQPAEGRMGRSDKSPCRA